MSIGFCFSQEFKRSGTSQKWNQTIFVLKLAYFTKHSGLSLFTHDIACVRISFLSKANSVGCTQHVLCIHSSICGYLGCFYLLAIVNYAAIHTSVQIPI